MKKFLTLFFIGLTTLAYGQKFDMADFSRKMEVAKWLIEYDEVAWVTSDSVMAQDEKEQARLGSEWFCFEKDSIWHAVYGKYENNQFDLVFHYKVSDGKVIRTSEAVDTSLLHRYSRALQTANSQIMAIRKSINLRFNQYIKENDDKTFTVWILPAFQPSGIAVYGGEFIYTIDKTGTKLLKDDSYFQNEFRGFKVDVNDPIEISLNYQDVKKPTLGAVFFGWYYKSYFTKIEIDCSESISYPIKLDSGWTWFNVEKVPKEKE